MNQAEVAALFSHPLSGFLRDADPPFPLATEREMLEMKSDFALSDPIVSKRLVSATMMSQNVATKCISVSRLSIRNGS